MYNIVHTMHGNLINNKFIDQKTAAVGALLSRKISIEVAIVNVLISEIRSCVEDELRAYTRFLLK